MTYLTYRRAILELASFKYMNATPAKDRMMMSMNVLAAMHRMIEQAPTIISRIMNSMSRPPRSVIRFVRLGLSTLGSEISPLPPVMSTFRILPVIDVARLDTVTASQIENRVRGQARMDRKKTIHTLPMFPAINSLIMAITAKITVSSSMGRDTLPTVSDTTCH